MASEIAILLQDFGSTIGLGSDLDLSKDGTIRLNLEEDCGIDFEEDPNGEKVWIYCDLFPGVDKTITETQPPVEQLDEHLKKFVTLVETLRGAVKKQ